MTQDTETINEKAKEQIQKEVDSIYLNHLIEPSERDHSINPSKTGPCDACGSQRNGRVEITSEEYKRYVCPDCRDKIFEKIDNYYWYDRFTRGHYKIIAAFLRSLDEVWCVKDNAYAGGEMFVHTPYFTTAVVHDVLDYFGTIYSVQIERVDDSCWDCMEEHGDCVEINIDFGDETAVNPIPTDVFAECLWSRGTYDVEFVDEEDKLFTRD